MNKLIKQLKESSAPFLSDPTVSSIIKKAINNLSSIGLNISDDLKFKIFEHTNILGRCGINIDEDGSISHTIWLNTYLCREGLEDLIINNVYHELCHYKQNQELVELANKEGFGIIINKERGFVFTDRLIQKYFQENEGHGECWYKYVNQVNSKLKPVIPVTAHPEEAVFNNYIDANDDSIKFIIRCDSCDSVIKVLSYNTDDDFPPGFIEAIMMMQDNNEKNTFCKCGGSLYIDPVEHDALDRLKANMTKDFLSMMLSRMFK